MRGFGAEVDRAICPSTVTGRCCAVGCVPIGASHKRNSRSTWGFSSSFTTCESEAKRCWERSLSYSSQKTLESNKSEHPLYEELFRTVILCSNDVPVATQTRLSFDVILPLWGRRGPR